MLWFDVDTFCEQWEVKDKKCKNKNNRINSWLPSRTLEWKQKQKWKWILGMKHGDDKPTNTHILKRFLNKKKRRSSWFDSWFHFENNRIGERWTVIVQRKNLLPYNCIKARPRYREHELQFATLWYPKWIKTGKHMNTRVE